MLFACFVCVCVFIFHEYLMMVVVAFVHTLCVHSIKPNESSQVSGIVEVLYKCLFVSFVAATLRNWSSK